MDGPLQNYAFRCAPPSPLHGIGGEGPAFSLRLKKTVPPSDGQPKGRRASIGGSQMGRVSYFFIKFFSWLAGLSGLWSMSFKSLTILSVPCLYFRKLGGAGLSSCALLLRGSNRAGFSGNLWQRPCFATAICGPAAVWSGGEGGTEGVVQPIKAKAMKTWPMKARTGKTQPMKARTGKAQAGQGAGGARRRRGGSPEDTKKAAPKLLLTQPP